MNGTIKDHEKLKAIYLISGNNGDSPISPKIITLVPTSIFNDNFSLGKTDTLDLKLCNMKAKLFPRQSILHKTNFTLQKNYFFAIFCERINCLLWCNKPDYSFRWGKLQKTMKKLLIEDIAYRRNLQENYLH